MAGFFGMGSVIETHAKNAWPLHRAQQANVLVIVDLIGGDHCLKWHTAQTAPLFGRNLLSVMDIVANGITRDDHRLSFQTLKQ
jgi:hypothetical protein